MSEVIDKSQSSQTPKNKSGRRSLLLAALPLFAFMALAGIFYKQLASLRDAGFDIETRQVKLDQPIKELGIYQVPIAFPGDTRVEVKVWVVESKEGRESVEDFAFAAPEAGVIGDFVWFDANEDQTVAEFRDADGNGALTETPVDVVFIGSCTNSRLGDLRQVADLLRGRHVANGVRMLIVPGSQQVKKEAEALGLHEVFLAAGAEWRESGCSMCLGMNGDIVEPGRLSVSTSNRNFEGRQGKGARTVLASPLTAAASAITGRIADPRAYME